MRINVPIKSKGKRAAWLWYMGWCKGFQEDEDKFTVITKTLAYYIRNKWANTVEKGDRKLKGQN